MEKSIKNQVSKKTQYSITALIVFFFIFDRLIKDNVFDIGNMFPRIINTGIAFDVPVLEWLLWPVLVVVLGYVVFSLTATIRDGRREDTILLLALLAGALSNVIDRVMYGGVIDYLEITAYLPIFNTADILISGSITLLALKII